MKLSEKTNKILEYRFIKPVAGSLKTFFFGESEHALFAPFIKDNIDLKRYMVFVLLALIPSIIAGIYFYGWRIAAVIAVSYVFGVGTEAVCAGIRRQNEIHEGAFVTCMLYALILPPTVPLWIAAAGILFGTIFGKEIFGGTGKNIFNPAMSGRIFVAFAFPSDISGGWIGRAHDATGGFAVWVSDAVTGATPLMDFKSSHILASFKDVFLGYIPGCIGETCKPLIILGGIFLIITKIADWRTPLSFLLAIIAGFAVLHTADTARFAPVWFHLCTGGILFASMFMITDPVTSPLTSAGKWVFGFLCGIITVLIRSFTGYTEGVMFALIIMNVFAPLIDQAVFSYKFREAKYDS